MTRDLALTAAAVRREYERAAASYDRRWSRYEDRSLALLRPHLAARPLGDVLDVGCGTGALLPRLDAWGAQVARYVGVDPSPAMLRVAVEKVHGASFDAARFVAGTAEAIPLPSASFDTVVCASTLQYVADVPRALGEMRRVLRPSGRLVLLGWARDFWSMKMLDVAMRAARVPYCHMASTAEVRGQLRDAGFRVSAERREKIGRVWGLMVFEAMRD